MAILQGMIKIHGIIEPIFKASVFMYYFKTHNILLEAKPHLLLSFKGSSAF